MQLIKRKIKEIEKPKLYNMKAVGFNTNDVLTFSFLELEEGEDFNFINNKNGEILINLNGKELEKLKSFLNKINTRGFNG